MNGGARDANEKSILEQTIDEIDRLINSVNMDPDDYNEYLTELICELNARLEVSSESDDDDGVQSWD